MTQLNLTDDEAKVLRKALESYLSDLRMEIAGTEQEDFRDGLKQEKGVLKKIMGML